ncbi:MAG: FecCD family ABC transporter permease [Thermogutta sp.]
MNRRLGGFVIILVVVFLVLGIAPFVGGEWILPWKKELMNDAVSRQILLHLRLPRVLTGFVAGAALAVGGVAFQAMFRNPLATPYTLGVASGASLGAVLSLQCGLAFSVWGFSTTSLFALCGAIITLLVVYGISFWRAELSVATMLLAGVAMSFFNSSLILILQYVSDPVRVFRAFRWMLGGLEGTVGYGELKLLLPMVTIGCVIIFSVRRELNLLTLGDEWAVSRGVSLLKIKALVLFLTGWMIASVVAICGPIGFVCLIVPHITRLLVGPEHGRLIPAAALLGGAFLVVCDTVARTVLAPSEIPVGVITSLLGGPFFLWLLIKRPLFWEWLS